jgi:lipid A 4'-phosphatase
MKIQNLFKSFPWWGPLLLFIIVAPFTPKWDMDLAHYAYRDGSFSDHPFFKFFYDWGEIPALAISALALLVVAISFFTAKLKPWRTDALYLFLVFAVGGGLITNLMFKEHWGRPRPKQVIEFGGAQQFHPFYKPNFSAPEPSKSFPCGHCTTGFYFFALVFLGRRLHKKYMTATGWILGLGMGLALSVSRIFQGGHFLSDIFAGALVMWYSALILDWLLYSDS